MGQSAFRARILGVLLNFFTIVGCGSLPPATDIALTCQSVIPPSNDFHQFEAIGQEFAKIPDRPDTIDRRLALLDQLSGFGLPLEGQNNLKAEPALKQSLALREREGRRSEPAYTEALYRLGYLQWNRSSFKLARDTLLRCRESAARAFGHDSLEYANCQHWLGVVYNDLGLYSEAKQSLSDAAEVRLHLLGPQDLDYAYSLFSLGSVYIRLNDYSRAEELNLQSLQIRETVSGSCGRFVGDSLNNLGFIYRERGQPIRAMERYKHALTIREAWLGLDDPLVAQTMSNLGLALGDLGRHEEAHELLERSLEIRERRLGPYHQRTVTGIWNLVQNLKADNKLTDAESYLQRGLRGAFASGDPRLIWRFQDAYRAFYQLRRKPKIAIFFGKQAVNTIQGLRPDLTKLDPSLQRSFVKDKQAVYRGLADLLIDEGRLPEAQEVIKMLKEDELFEFLRRDSQQDVRTTQASSTGKEAKLAAQFKQVGNNLMDIGSDLEELEKKASQGMLTAADKARRDELDTKRINTEEAFKRFLGDLIREFDSSVTRKGNREIGERNLANLKLLQKSLSKLGHGAVTLHYIVREHRTVILLTTPWMQIPYETKVESRYLNIKIQNFLDALKNSNSNPLPLAQELYQILLHPVADDLRKAKAHTLMISLDGALRYLPFAALHDDQHYLAETYTLAIYTEAANVSLLEEPSHKWQFEGLGLTKEVEGFNPLPAVREELKGINSIMPGNVYFDHDFNAAQFQSSIDRHPPLLHLASHFVFNPGTETDSFLVLGDGTHMSLDKLEHYRFWDVDLITLSACQTGVGGGQDTNGFELEGFGAVVQIQGAKGVIATLWSVADHSTALFMQEFYRIWKNTPGLTKAEALRLAQLKFIKGTQGDEAKPPPRGVHLTSGTAVSSAPYAHPYYWAPFILIGNWL